MLFYEVKDGSGSLNDYSSTGTLPVMKIKFNSSVSLKYLMWYRGSATGTPTVEPRVYSLSGSLLASGASIVESTKTIGWYTLNLNQPIKLEKDTEYYIGFNFTDSSPIAYVSSQSVPRTIVIDNDLSMTITGGVNINSAPPFSHSNSVHVIMGYGIDIYFNKFLISLGNGEVRSVMPSENRSIIPSMTSYTSAGNTVSASSERASYPTWQAFDGNDTTSWFTPTNIVSGWLRCNLSESKKATGYYIVGSVDDITFSPKNWTFEGSNDGTAWTVLDTQANQSWTLKQKREYVISNNIAFFYYKINVTANNGSTAFLSVAEFNVIEYVSPKIKFLDDSLERTFINHGMDESDVLDLSTQLGTKVLLRTSSETLGSGKVFKKTIDTSKIPIKKVSIT